MRLKELVEIWGKLPESGECRLIQEANDVERRLDKLMNEVRETEMVRGKIAIDIEKEILGKWTPPEIANALEEDENLARRHLRAAKKGQRSWMRWAGALYPVNHLLKRAVYKERAASREK